MRRHRLTNIEDGVTEKFEPLKVSKVVARTELRSKPSRDGWLAKIRPFFEADIGTHDGLAEQAWVLEAVACNLLAPICSLEDVWRESRNGDRLLPHLRGLNQCWSRTAPLANMEEYLRESRPVRRIEEVNGEHLCRVKRSRDAGLDKGRSEDGLDDVRASLCGQKIRSCPKC